MKRLLAAALVALASVVGAQVIDMQGAQTGLNAFKQGQYLKADEVLKAAALNADGTIRDEAAFQIWDQIRPMLTGETPVGGLRPRAATPMMANPQWLDALREAEPRDAIAEIVARARETRIVILNEAHNSPRDRAFGLEVARALRPLGYSFLAAEAFDNPGGGGGKPSTVEQLNRDGFVRGSTGHYTRDPVFSGFVRVAMRLGYRPVSYEQTMEQGAGATTTRERGISVREEAEAQNLYAAAFRDRPDVKMLIYVGYSHVAEAPIGSAGHANLWMAARLKQLTGIDPLTIDQTSVTDTSPQALVAYEAAAARISSPSVFVSKGKPVVLGQFAPAAVDLQVVHPRRTYKDGRPVWLATLGGTPLAVPAALLPTHGRRLIQAFDFDAPADAIPLDQVLIEAGRPVPKLMVPMGKVRLAVQDPD